MLNLQERPPSTAPRQIFRNDTNFQINAWNGDSESLSISKQTDGNLRYIKVLLNLNQYPPPIIERTIHRPTDRLFFGLMRVGWNNDWMLLPNVFPAMAWLQQRMHAQS